MDLIRTSKNEMNVFCLDGKVIGSAFAWELIETFWPRTLAVAYATDAGCPKCRNWRARKFGHEGFV